jgi:tight adherence protein B
MGILVFIFTFLVATALVLALWMFASTDSNQELIRRRMAAVRKAEHRGEVSLGLKLARDEMLSSVPLVHRLLMQWSWPMRFQDLMVQAGLKVKPARLLLLSGILAIGAYLIAGQFISRFPIPLLAGIGTGTIPLIFVVWKRNRRLRQFEEHFPEALDLLGRAVRAGHAFTTGLEMIGKESAEPLAGEFRTAFEEQNFGLPLRDALLNLSERIPIIDVRFFVTALMIQKETGGNLAEILDGLSRVIRERFRIYRDVRVKTAQGRLSAAILIALPPGMMVILSSLNPQYIRVLIDDPLGPTALAIAATLQFIGSAIIWKVIHFEV